VRIHEAEAFDGNRALGRRDEEDGLLTAWCSRAAAEDRCVLPANGHRAGHEDDAAAARSEQSCIHEVEGAVQNHGSPRIDRLLHRGNVNGSVVLTNHVAHDDLESNVMDEEIEVMTKQWDSDGLVVRRPIQKTKPNRASRS
jgi:hypothetical protein